MAGMTGQPGSHGAYRARHQTDARADNRQTRGVSQQPEDNFPGELNFDSAAAR
jgi:hypothetical protein